MGIYTEGQNGRMQTQRDIHTKKHTHERDKRENTQEENIKLMRYIHEGKAIYTQKTLRKICARSNINTKTIYTLRKNIYKKKEKMAQKGI